MIEQKSDKVDQLEHRIGEQIRREREIRSWSLTDLAEHSGVSRAMVHKLEKGDASPTASLLTRLAATFGLSGSTLLARAEARPARFMPRDDQPTTTDAVTGCVTRRISPPSGLPVELMRVELPPHTEMPSPAADHIFRQFLIWMLRGELTVIEGDVRHVLAAGDCLELVLPLDCIFRNDSDEVCAWAVATLTRRI